MTIHYVINIFLLRDMEPVYYILHKSMNFTNCMNRYLTTLIGIPGKTRGHSNYM